jgi:hypothetical protein
MGNTNRDRREKYILIA